MIVFVGFYLYLRIQMSCYHQILFFSKNASRSISKLLKSLSVEPSIKRAKKKFGKTLQESFLSFTFVRYYKKFVMGCIFVIRGILIYIYAFDHNPPHIHVRSGTDNFSITIEDRIIEGIARTTTITIINKFIDDKKDELLEIWDKAQKGEKINKIR